MPTTQRRYDENMCLRDGQKCDSWRSQINKQTHMHRTTVATRDKTFPQGIVAGFVAEGLFRRLAKSGLEAGDHASIISRDRMLQQGTCLGTAGPRLIVAASKIPTHPSDSR